MSFTKKNTAGRSSILLNLWIDTVTTHDKNFHNLYQGNLPLSLELIILSCFPYVISYLKKKIIIIILKKYSLIGLLCWSALLCLVTSVVSNYATPWTSACQAPLSTGFSIQEYWWVAMPSSRGASWPRDQTNLCLLHCTWILYHWATGKAHYFEVWNINKTGIRRR